MKKKKKKNRQSKSLVMVIGHTVSHPGTRSRSVAHRSYGETDRRPDGPLTPPIPLMTTHRTHTDFVMFVMRGV